MSPLDSQNITEQKELPLLGKRILVTRPGSQGKDFALKLRKLGAEPILMPMIEITKPDSWNELDLAIKNIDKYQWLFFASSNAVISFVIRLANKSQSNSTVIESPNIAVVDDIAALKLSDNIVIGDKTALELPDVAVIGETTANTARKLGLKVSYCPNNFIAEDFVDQFPGYPDNLHNTKILWPRTNHGRDFIVNELQAAGAAVHIVTAYKTELTKNTAQLGNQLLALIDNEKIDAITLASKQTAINLAKIINASLLPMTNVANPGFISQNSLSLSLVERERQSRLKNALQDILIVTIGPETSEGALNYLGKVDREAYQHSSDGIINALIKALH